MSCPGVDLVRHPVGATDLVLLAHGGEEYSRADPHRWRPALLRMWPFARMAASAAPDAAVGFVRYRFRGWNDDGDPALDLRAVLDELPSVIVRVFLIGHSMGGRAVVAAGNHPRVAGVLALAPWLPVDEPLSALRPPVTFVHGTDDTITDPAGTTAYADRLRDAGVAVTTYSLAGEGHAMLRRAKDWNRLVAEFVTSARAGSAARAESTAGAGSAAGGGTEHLPQLEPATPLAAVWDIAATRFRLRVKARFQLSGSSTKSKGLGLLRRSHPR